jgi:predicted dehydrogenase
MNIGIIGVGGVARYAHLPAYRKLGLNVAALCDRDAEVVQQVGAEFDIPIRTTDPLELMNNPSISVIDLATPPDSHRELLELATEFHKPVLVQKPLCVTRDDFKAIQRLRQRGPRIRLNVTGRYVSAWRKVRELVQSGALGQPVLCTIINRDWWDRTPERWDHNVEQYVIFEMVIHHLDLCLFWFGMPERLTARTGTHPRQRIQQANWATVTLEYANGFVVQIVDDWTMSEFAFASGHPFEQVHLTGEHGVIRANSERVEWSELGTNSMKLWHLPRPGQQLAGEQLETNWFPDSFGQSMLAFVEALEQQQNAAEDWDHLTNLTELTLAVSAAAKSSNWISTQKAQAA